MARSQQLFFTSSVIGINYYALKANTIIFILTTVVYLLFLPGLKADCGGFKKPDLGLVREDDPQEKTGGRKVTIVNYDKLVQVFTKNDNVLYVVNFWATWCTPCVKELPDFMEVDTEFKNSENFKMILVSLDDAEEVDGTVKKIIREKKLDTEHYLLDDIKRMNEWIPAIDSLWSGSIPATLFIKNGKKLKFTPTSLDKEELRSIITELMNQN